MSGVKQYLKSIEQALSAGISTEHTFRPALKELIESFASGIVAINEPKRIACGAPDFIITKSHVPLGYIEAKDIGKSLDEVERSDQMARYLEGLGNLILTDYLEFRWYADGAHRLTACLARFGTKGKLQAEKEGIERFNELIEAFLNNRIPAINTPKDLAVRMAALAHIIRDTIGKAFDSEEGGGTLHQQMEGFRKVLLHDLTKEQFADMYAQTICYGLFAARCNTRTSEHFSREHAAYDLPKTNPFLRKMFTHIAGPDLDERITWVVDDLAELLARADIEAILRDFGKRTRQEDPVVHFYETFLAAYDPKMRKARGVYYTPEPVVSYIVRSVDHILKTDFKLKNGLADTSMIKVPNQSGKGKNEIHKVLILDPATGTGTFLHGIIDHIHESFKGNKGMWSGYVSQHLLPRLFGFELLMAPYAVAHMKLGLQLTETGYDFQADERLRVYLTNTLEEAHEMAGLPLFTQWLAEEANSAAQVKKDAPVMVIMGNPPYSGHSANVGEWINDLLRGWDSISEEKTGNYFEVDGKPLGERNPKWLNDDYVKFIRFSQWRIEQTGYGILAFITNHGYLDNPTFRGMRKSLMDTFDDMYLLNLHGNKKKKEKCPDGSEDKNVFDIQQGVAIGIFVKKPAGTSLKSTSIKQGPTVFHADLWGLRDTKYKWLWDREISSTEWAKLKPQVPHYLFILQNVVIREEYDYGVKVTEIMPLNSVGIVTARDCLTIHWDKQAAWDVAINFIRLSPEEARVKYNLDKDSQDWKIAWAQEDLKSSGSSQTNIVPILYRPFDVRQTYYTGHPNGFHCRPRNEIMNHLLNGENLGLITARSNKSQNPDHFFCSQWIMEAKCGESTTQSSMFPLYLYPQTEIEKRTGAGPYPNLAPDFVRNFASRLGIEFVTYGKGDRTMTFGPEDVFTYMYAVFHSPTYRSRYAEFLKIDFPRLPLTSDAGLFRELCGIGSELVDLHLMEKQIPMITTYPIAGDNTAENVRYTGPGEGSEKGRVWINKAQYFEGVSPEVWNFHIGGYQVCQKWLKDRKGRKLIYDDLTYYQRIIVALAETIRLMREIDKVIEEHDGWPIR